MILALSLALQNLLTYGVNLMDTLMLRTLQSGCDGRRRPVQSGPVPAPDAGRRCGRGRGRYGLAVLGQKKLEPIPHIIGVALRFGGSLAVLLFRHSAVCRTRLLSLLSNSPTAVIAEGAKYFQHHPLYLCHLHHHEYPCRVTAFDRRGQDRLHDLRLDARHQRMPELSADLRQSRLSGDGRARRGLRNAGSRAVSS